MTVSPPGICHYLLSVTICNLALSAIWRPQVSEGEGGAEGLVGKAEDDPPGVHQDAHDVHDDVSVVHDAFF